MFKSLPMPLNGPAGQTGWGVRKHGFRVDPLAAPFSPTGGPVSPGSRHAALTRRRPGRPLAGGGSLGALVLLAILPSIAWGDVLAVADYRGVERLFIVLTAGMSLVLGWDLFRRGITDPQTGVVKTDAVEIKLAKVGPGIFFALFGAAVLVVAIVNVARFDADPGAPADADDAPAQVRPQQAAEPIPPAERQRGGSYSYGGDTVMPDRALVRAINTVASLETTFLDALPPDYLMQVMTAVETLRQTRDAVISAQSRDPEAVREVLQALQAEGVEGLSAEQRGLYDVIEPWLSDGTVEVASE